MSRKRKKYDKFSRRKFLKNTASLAAFTIVPSHVLGGNVTAPSDTVYVASIGAGGQAASDIQWCNSNGGRIVALCDVDDTRAAEIYKKFPMAAKYKDFRIMLDKEYKNIDAVIIGTPDHTHAVATMESMKRGKHVYCEKPLAHSLYEVRMITEAAEKYKVVTQLGNQGHANEQMRLICEWIQDGAIGDVREVHTFVEYSNSCIGNLPKMSEKHEIPDALDWDLWLGPAPYRQYNTMYLPEKWRCWRQFGTGSPGDWICHTVDPSFLALKLKHPTSIEAVETGGYDPVAHKETFPPQAKIRFEFAARENMPPVTLYWYYGGLMPERPSEMEPERKWSYAGGLLIGDKGKMIHDSHGAQGLRIIPEVKMQAYERPPKTIPRSPGHMAEWINACKGRGETESNFEYGGPLTELAMLANIATLLPKRKLEWDPVNMKFPNCPEAEMFINPPYRQGWWI